MKKKILSIILILMLIGTIFTLTGCGSDATNNVVDDLNNAMNEILSNWKERGYGGTLSIYSIQNQLNKMDINYTIIASGDEEFTSIPESTEYIEEVSDYSGNSFDSMRMMEDELEVNYCVVYVIETGKYYNVQISYESSYVVSDTTETEYPVFSNATELK